MSNKKFDEEYIVKQYKLGRNTNSIAKEFGTYNTSIRRILLKNNVKLRSYSEANATFKGNPFKDLSNRNVMYWLGILATDGNISKKRNRINLTSKDRELLEQYTKFLNNKVKINKYKNSKYDIFEYYVNFSSEKVKTYLTKLGITPNKSYDLSINFDISWDFIRGCFDGDGHIKKNGKYNYFHITSASMCFSNQLMSFLEKEGFNPTLTIYNSKAETELYVINLFRQKEVKNLFNLLYNGATYFLKRKYDRFGYNLEETLDLEDR